MASNYNTTDGSQMKVHKTGEYSTKKFSTSSGIACAVQTVGDAIEPFVPLFSMVTTIVHQLSTIYENAKCNQKICLALVERVEIAQFAVKSLQRQKQANEERFRNQSYYNAWVRFVNVLENIKKFAKEITQLSYFQKFINANAIKDAFEKNIKEFEEVCSDLHFTIAMYDVERREQEAKNVAEDIDLLNKSVDEVKSDLKVVMNEVAALASSMEHLNAQTSRSSGRHTASKTPLKEVYEAPKVDPNELSDPFASNDNVRGSRKTVIKKMFRGQEVACKKVPNIENNDTAQSQKVQGLSAEVKNLLDIVRWLAPEKMRVTGEHVMAKKRENLQIELCPSKIPSELAKIIKK
ncbi:10369_t:CDS:2, partial [Scutellospora calospora]